MLLNLTDLSSEPLQTQIVRQIRAKILSGETDAGAEIPSIRGLAKDGKVSFITVQKAYETLVNEGLIHPRRGKGYYVAPLTDKNKRQMAAERLKEHITPLIHNALNEGLSENEIKDAVNKIFSGNI